MENKKITIYSYAKVWKVEKKIYNLGNIIFPVPIELWNAVCFAAVVFWVCIFQKIFPVITTIPVIVRLGVIPYGIMYLLRKIKLDGKNPVKYFAGVFVHLLYERYICLERFVSFRGSREHLYVNWNCSMAYPAVYRSGKKGNDNV